MKYLNLALLILFPIAWFAPLLRAALLPIFGMDEISVITGLQSLVGNRRGAGAAGHLPCDLRALCQDHRPCPAALRTFCRPEALPALDMLGKLAMADVFLIALYIVIVKGAGYVTIETAWGLYLFTGCILASILIIQWQGRSSPAPSGHRLDARACPGPA